MTARLRTCVTCPRRPTTGPRRGATRHANRVCATCRREGRGLAATLGPVPEYASAEWHDRVDASVLSLYAFAAPLDRKNRTPLTHHRPWRGPTFELLDDVEPPVGYTPVRRQWVPAPDGSDRATRGTLSHDRPTTAPDPEDTP